MNYLTSCELTALEELYEDQEHNSYFYNLLVGLHKQECEKINGYRKSLIEKFGKPEIGSKWELENGRVVTIKKDRDNSYPYGLGYKTECGLWCDFHMDGDRCEKDDFSFKRKVV